MNLHCQNHLRISFQCVKSTFPPPSCSHQITWFHFPPSTTCCVAAPGFTSPFHYVLCICPWFHLPLPLRAVYLPLVSPPPSTTCCVSAPGFTSPFHYVLCICPWFHLPLPLRVVYLPLVSPPPSTTCCVSAPGFTST